MGMNFAVHQPSQAVDSPGPACTTSPGNRKQFFWLQIPPLVILLFAVLGCISCTQPSSMGNSPFFTSTTASSITPSRQTSPSASTPSSHPPAMMSNKTITTIPNTKPKMTNDPTMSSLTWPSQTTAMVHPTSIMTSGVDTSTHKANIQNIITVEKEHICNCSEYCTGKAAFYTFGIEITESSILSSDISNLIAQIKTPPPCINSTLRQESPCPYTVASSFQDAHEECDRGQSVLKSSGRTCRVILSFSNVVPICGVRMALLTVLSKEKGILYDGSVTRAAICGWPGIGEVPLKSSKFTWEVVNLQPSEFCEVQFSLLSCRNGKNMCVLLDEHCDREPTPSPLNTTTAPLITTYPTNRTSITARNTTTLPGNSPQGQSNSSTTETITHLPVVSSVSSATASPVPSTIKSPTTPTTVRSGEEQANQLLEITKDVSHLNASQVDELVYKLEGLLAGPKVSLALGNTSIHIVSNLLSASPNILDSLSTRIIGIVNTVGLKLVVYGGIETLLSQSLALSVKTVNGKHFQEISFSISDPSCVQVLGAERGRSAKTSSLSQGSIQLPPSLTQNLTAQQQQLASRVQFTFYQKCSIFQDKALKNRKLNSGILGTSVANLSITGLQDEVIITLKNIKPVTANHTALCVFWDFDLNDGSGGWNPEGCSVQNSSDIETVCGCNHLTSFAVLLDMSREGTISRVQATILTYITYIGCGISAVFLSVTLLTYLAFAKLRKDVPSKILIQLCLALLLLNLVFLVDSWLALYPNAMGLCISTAFFLHYFLLSCFTWMGLEAVHMYLALIKVFNCYISRYMLKFSLIGWGIPLIVVIVVITVNKNNYGLVTYGKYTDGAVDDFCWLKNDIAFYVAVVAYFCIIFLFNLIMFLVVMVQLLRIKRQNPHNMQHRSRLQDLCSVAGITFLLGFTWGFAFFAWGPVNLVFMYLFAIFNSLQGFFIFVFHCAAKENVWRQWRTYLCCGRLKLAENSEWSRTVTQKMANKSLTRETSLQSLSSQSNNSYCSIVSSFLSNDTSEHTNSISI